MKIEIKIPDIAENVKTGIISRLLVSEGDHVNKDQPVAEVETDKATTDIPSNYEGDVSEIRVKEGDEVEVGQVIIVLEGEGKEEEKEGNEEEEKEKGEDDEKEPKDMAASPLARRLAREHDIDLSTIVGSGPGGRITRDDILEQTKTGNDKDGKESRKDETELSDFSQWGHIEKVTMYNIRKLTASKMSDSWRKIPHVTQFDEADVTDLEKFINENEDEYREKGSKLTITSILLKLSAFALTRFQRFNSSLDEENDQIILKKYYNIGVAVDTEQGLLVPVIRDVDKKPLIELTNELSELAEKARNKKISPDELQGGNFTISNLGGIGGTSFTPIVYSPQVAILGVSKSRYKPVYINDEIEKRLILPLSLSYDHRVIDGAEAARFLRWMCEVLENPFFIFQ